MLILDESLRAWGTAEFEAVLKHELAQQAGQLPLQQGLSSSSSVAESPITVMILNVDDLEEAISMRAGIFYRGVVGGCSCADDPTPDGENAEYCEIQLDIDKETAVAAIKLLT